ncbi:PepSY domain-containing protein [Shewanella subflava]|uniref:PepSY domain-containing protein n=1 Tax=Shewanella subflava TaxID=2986476 RepID=A0ABT3I7Y2_9GAMM|nr:PepSY domain-containing protein [Shewanella subflava]MCW3172146.1 PepSY domain-containing protein [Shewanella subflava]
MRWIRKWHKWVSVIVGIQVVLWLVSGLYFNLMDHTKAAGLTYFSQSKVSNPLDATMWVEPKAVLEQHRDSVALDTVFLLGKPFYLLSHQQGLYAHSYHQYTLVDGYSGEVVTLDAKWISKLAQASYTGGGKVAKLTLLTPPISAFPKQQNPTWQVNFADDIGTEVYVEAQSGRIVGHSDEHKKLADIFFMLHFMDYNNQGSFNNVPMMLMAFFSLWLTMTGCYWCIDLLRKGKLSRKRRNRLKTSAIKWS